MPIFLVMLLTAAAAAVPWPAPADEAGSAAFLAFSILAPLLAGAVLARWATLTVRRAPDRRAEVAAKYGRIRRRIGLLLLFSCLAAVPLGWGWWVWNRALLQTGKLAPFAELLVPAPYLFAVVLNWLLHYSAERELHRASSDGQKPFFTRREHLLQNFRPFTLMILVPLGFFSAVQSLSRFFPETANHPALQLGLFLALILLFVLFPLLAKRILGLVPLPAGPIRTRLEAVSAAQNFRFRDFLLWPTRGHTANALLIGVIPQARYVVFTDALLEGLAPDELDAVLGHEIGHVKHGHIPYYAAFFLLSMFVCTAAALALGRYAAERGWLDPATATEWAALPPLALTAGYLFVVFGFLSRKCERQADLFGCRVAGAGIDAMIRALQRVAFLNGLDTEYVPPRSVRGLRAKFRAWLHGPIPERIHFLQKVLADRNLEPAYQRRIQYIRWAIILVLLAAIAGLAQLIGWEELRRSL